MKIWCIHCSDYEEQDLTHEQEEFWVTYCPTHKEYTAHTVGFGGPPPKTILTKEDHRKIDPLEQIILKGFHGGLSCRGIAIDVYKYYQGLDSTPITERDE